MNEQMDIFNQIETPRRGVSTMASEEIRVVSLLREGKENARGVHWLAEMVGVSDVKLRETVRHLIGEHGYCIGSRTGEPAGYYLITDESEINEVYRSLRHRGISILVRASKLKRISLEEVFGQGTL
ncbi:MAG: hypothetical protein HY998_08570 [candidate division NC10 bacterium]|nr:hypothetical protein [candidate division NC10 bacterium]